MTITFKDNLTPEERKKAAGFKCNWDDFKKVLETTDIIPITDSRIVGSDYTSEPVIQPMGKPTGFASIYEEACIAPSKDKTILLVPTKAKKPKKASYWDDFQ